jgi:hypothetical protein
MDIVTSVRLTPEEEAQLVLILGGDVAGLPQKLGELGRAALREYVDVILAQTALRSPEVREQRLLQIILESNQGHVPSEAEVGQLFGLTGSGARSLIRSVLSRHRLRLREAVAGAARTVLDQCEAEEDGFRRVSILNPIIVEYLNELLAELNGALKRITREPKTGTYFLIPEDSFLALDDKLNP